MGILDKLKGLVSGREEQVKESVDKAAAAVDEKTGGKYSDQINQAKDKIDEQLSGGESAAKDQPTSSN